MIKTIYLLTFLLAVSPISAQYYPLPFPPKPRQRQSPPEQQTPVEVGGYATLGVQSNYDPQQPNSIGSGTLGLYADWTTHRFHPGLDLRVSGNQGAVHGALVGPRVACTLLVFHPYVEALFGPNELYSNPDSYPTSQQRTGITSQFVLGVDGDLGQHWRWRIIEFTQGTFTGLPNSAPRSITTGVVLHL